MLGATNSIPVGTTSIGTVQIMFSRQSPKLGALCAVRREGYLKNGGTTLMYVAILIFVGLFAGSVGIGAGVARRTNPQRGLSQPAHRFLRRGDLAVGGVS